MLTFSRALKGIPALLAHCAGRALPGGGGINGPIDHRSMMHEPNEHDMADPVKGRIEEMMQRPGANT